MRQSPILAIVGALLVSGAGRIADSPRAFLEQLYRPYFSHGKGASFAYPQARAIVDSSVLALLRRDRLKSKGEVGALDFDPICQCQDWGPFNVLSVSVQRHGLDQASGQVTFANGSNSKKDTVGYTLILANGVWKIHDMSWQGTPSLQGYLRNYKY